MRAGGACSLQQALTPEATSVVKQALTLARRRGHAQVTPLHVANTMLSSPNALLRAACLRSNSHPFQCRALELCFNVALNRLPAATPATTFTLHGPASQYHHHHHVPSISNALIAAFKRAQAHQRRGSIENNNQALLSVKIELDQLVISILDDPSVSRVMREAGFSSSQVKNDVERVAASTETPPPLLISDNSEDKDPNVVFPVESHDDHVMHVVNTFADKTRHCIVVVGECSDSTEAVVASVIDKLTNNISHDIFKTLNFINLCLSSLEHHSGDEARRKLEALKIQLGEGDGVVLLIGDLKWVVDRRPDSGIENVIMEIGRLIHGVGENRRIWILATADLQTFMRCKSGYPSLETVWRLHPVAINLTRRLSSNDDTDREFEGRISTAKLGENGSSPWVGELMDNCGTTFTNDDDLRRSSSILPPWLQQCKPFDKKLEGVPKKYWNQICSSTTQVSQHFHFNDKTLSFPSLSPSLSSSSSGLSREEHNQLFSSSSSMDAAAAASVDLNLAPTLPLLPYNSPSVSPSSSDVMEIEYISRFDQKIPENLETLTRELERKVPWQRAIIPEIATTILNCRSGTIQRRGSYKKETWLVFQGIDRDGKEKIARELARVVFGSYSSFVSIGRSTYESDEERFRLFERFSEKVSRNPHRVFFVENAEEADCVEFKKATESGKFKNPNFGGEEVDMRDGIVIFSSEIGDDEARGREEGSSLSFDLNVCIDLEEDHAGTMFEWVDRRVVFKIQELL